MKTKKHRGQGQLFYKWMDSPVGKLKLVASDHGLIAILWERERPGRVPLNIAAEDGHHPMLVEAERQLNEYFGGRRKSFALKLNFDGTLFQQRVWRALLTIPFGETRSYGEIARQIGNPTATRAVGAANARSAAAPSGVIAPRANCWSTIEPRSERCGWW